jgi:hypothetical protein
MKMKMYTHIICRSSDIPSAERRELTPPNWSLYLNNVKYRGDNPNWNQTIKLNVNQHHNALKTQ